MTVIVLCYEYQGTVLAGPVLPLILSQIMVSLINTPALFFKGHGHRHWNPARVLCYEYQGTVSWISTKLGCPRTSRQVHKPGLTQLHTLKPHSNKTQHSRTKITKPPTENPKFPTITGQRFNLSDKNRMKNIEREKMSEKETSYMVLFMESKSFCKDSICLSSTASWMWATPFKPPP